VAMAGNLAVVPIEEYRREVTTLKGWLKCVVIPVRGKVLYVVILEALVVRLMARLRIRMMELVRWLMDCSSSCVISQTQSRHISSNVTWLVGRCLGGRLRRVYSG